MKKIIFLFFLILTQLSYGQSFSFQNKSFTFHRTTNHSPLHWYLSIFSNQETDINLRWKIIDYTVPSEWDLIFNDENEIYSEIGLGDSADFVLFSNLEIPQKLIINAILNDEPGKGVVSFEIFNPLNSVEKDTIHYYFFVTEGTLIVENNSSLNSFIEIANNSIKILNGIDTQFEIYNEVGQLLIRNSSDTSIDLEKLKENNLYFINLKQENRSYNVKIHKIE